MSCVIDYESFMEEWTQCEEIYVTHLPGGVDSINWDVNTNTEFPPSGDKIFILWAGMVTTLRMVVLVWFTNVLAESIHAIMIAENIELKQYFNLNSHPFAD